METPTPTSEVVLPMPRKQPAKARVSIVKHVYHQVVGEKATNITTRTAHALDSDDSPYLGRRIKVGTEWQPLDKGWVDQPGLIVVENTNALIGLEIGISAVSLFEIKPGSAFDACPTSFDSLQIRASAPARYNITVCPR